MAGFVTEEVALMDAMAELVIAAVVASDLEVAVPSYCFLGHYIRIRQDRSKEGQF